MPLLPSKIRFWAAVLLTLALSILLWQHYSGTAYWLFQAAVTAAAVYALYPPRNPIAAIKIHPRQTASLVFADGREEAAELISGSLISPYFLALKWRCGGSLFWQTLLPDMTDADAWRRLIVWARFCRSVPSDEDLSS